MMTKFGIGNWVLSVFTIEKLTSESSGIIINMFGTSSEYDT